jgi:hypothetical protein
MKLRFEWDDNPFRHQPVWSPYQGSNYYTAGRANGLSYWSRSADGFWQRDLGILRREQLRLVHDIVNYTLAVLRVVSLSSNAWMISQHEGDRQGTPVQENRGHGHRHDERLEPLHVRGRPSRVRKPATFAPKGSDRSRTTARCARPYDNAFSEAPSRSSR